MAESTPETAEPEAAPVEEIRQDMVDTAIKFLTNPKVVSSPISRKTAFLENKGLNAGEIQKAMEAVAAGGAGGGAGSSVVGVAQQSVAVAPSAPSTWKDYFIGTVVAASAAYGVTLAMKNYVIPRLGLFGGGETRQMLEDLNTSITGLQDDVAAKTAAIKESVDASNDAATEQLHNIMRRVVSLESLPNHSQAISEIKSELGSIKSLLLNRRQFAAPSPQAVAPPSIPAWQRTSHTAAIAPATPVTPLQFTPGSATPVPSVNTSTPQPPAAGSVVPTPHGHDATTPQPHPTPNSTPALDTAPVAPPSGKATDPNTEEMEDPGTSIKTPDVSFAADVPADGTTTPLKTGTELTYAQATSTPSRTPPPSEANAPV